MANCQAQVEYFRSIDYEIGTNWQDLKDYQVQAGYFRLIGL
jgi:hypothetical protein